MKLAMFQNLTSKGLPSLTGLRAFEAMARLGGATRAGEALNVTHSAVSRQVKALERSLGVRLFEGPKSRLTLTAEGRTLLAGLSPAFDALHEAVEAVRGRQEVRIAVHASLAVKWLIPRLSDFEARHPGIHVDLRDLPVDAVRARDVDLVLRLLDAGAVDLVKARVLGENRVGLVVAPHLAAQAETQTRLTSASHPRGWSDWQAAVGHASPRVRQRTLSHLHYVLDAALSGMGAAVLPWILVADAIEAGALVAPFGFVPDGGRIVTIGMGAEPSLPVRQVTTWLAAQVSETLEGPPFES